MILRLHWNHHRRPRTSYDAIVPRVVLTLAAAILLALSLLAWFRSQLPEYLTVRTYDGALIFFFYGRDSAIFIDPANHPSMQIGDPSFRQPNRRWDTEEALNAARKWGTSSATASHSRFLGFELIFNRQELRWNFFVSSIPFWAITLFFAAITTWGLLSLRRNRRWRREGRCPRCGYDLRATPGHCPECGWKPESTAANAVHGG